MIKPKMLADKPVAVDSHDHLVPRGTVNDNTKNEQYIKYLIDRFGEDMRYMDLGCAGGGFVAQFHEHGVFAVGVEGSDYNFITKRAEWANYPEYLFTADISKPFNLVDENDKRITFDVISLFDVLEHIHEDDLPQLMTNIYNSLKPEGIVVTSIATFGGNPEDPDYHYHVTLHDRDWWADKFKEHGMPETDGLPVYGRESSFNAVYKKA